MTVTVPENERTPPPLLRVTRLSWRRSITIAALSLLLLLAAALGLAIGLAPYELGWTSTDGGGGMCAGGSYEVFASIGQPDAGVASGGQYEVSGGFLNRKTASVPVELVSFEIE